MEKWKTRGKGAKADSVLPPTRRPAVPTCLPVDKKKDRKWSFGGLLRRISSVQNQDVSSNDEDITYIPGHMLSKRNTKKPSKMKSKLGKIPHQKIKKDELIPEDEISCGSKDTLELIRSLRANIDKSHDSLCLGNDSINSRSSDGSLDGVGRASRIMRIKARAQAKRDRLCGNSSSDDDSHRSSQSLVQFRNEDNVQNVQSPQRSDSFNRKTRGARTERYIKRMYRDDGRSGSDSKILKPTCGGFSRVIDSTHLRYSSNAIDSSHCRSSPSVVAERNLIVEKILPSREHQHDSRLADSTPICPRDFNENETFDREKFTWSQSFSKNTSQSNEIYGSLRQRKILPPEPPPRSSKSRVFTNAYNNTPLAYNTVNPETQSTRRYLTGFETKNMRSYNSDNEVLLSDHVAPVRLRYLWKNSDDVENSQTPLEHEQLLYPENKSYCNSLDRSIRSNYNTVSQKTREYREEPKKHDTRPIYHPTVTTLNNFTARSSSSLPKGIQLFSRQRLSHCGGDDATFITDQPHEDHIIPKLRKPREIRTSQPISSITTNRTPEDDEAERKRSSKNLEDALSELEAIYNSLRLSDEDLLERAEQRSMQEYRDKAAAAAAAKKKTPENSRKSSDASSIDKEESKYFGSSLQQDNDARIKDDMAYRRMNPKERPPSVNGQASLSQISYLATSPNLSSRDADYFDNRSRNSRRGTPDLTRDDVLFRSLSHANNTLKVIEPQPPFGIPLGPVTAATESDYLHIKPKLGQTRSLYIPQSEPDVISDDLAFRNLRKDPPKDSNNKNNTNLFIQNDSTIDSPFYPKNTFTFGAKKKRAVRSMSADLYGIMGKEKNKQSDWYNDYIQSTQKLRLSTDINDTSTTTDKKNLNQCNFIQLNPKTPDIDDSRDTLRANIFGLDINGNRPKSALQRKIQVYVPQETSIVEIVEKKCFSRCDDNIDDNKSRDSMKHVNTESEDSSQDRCDSHGSFISDVPASKDDKIKTIESFTEQELSEYKQLCQDLEKLIKRTAEAENKEKEDKIDIIEEYEDNNSQSEFDELEKLLIDDYELPVRIAAFDEIVESIERDDDQSSSRSNGFGAESMSSDNIQASPLKNPSKFTGDDDTSSISEIDAGSSNTNGSLTDSVYDKFNQLLREVNDVPYVEATKPISKYPIDDLDDNSDSQDSNLVIAENLVDEGLRDIIVKEKTQGATANIIYDVTKAKTDAIDTNLCEDKPQIQLDESTRQYHSEITEVKRHEDERKMEINDNNAVLKAAYRQGENVEEKSACNDGFYAFKDTSKHIVRIFSNLTNRVTAYHIVLCLLILTLLITIIVAQ